MYPRMKNAPVYFIIAQVRFNPILGLSTYVPAMQESLRKHGFPDFKKGFAMTIAFGQEISDEAQGQAPPAQPLERFIFGDTENTQNFLMEHASLSFQSTKYEVFETFRAAFMKGVELLDQTVGGLSFVERIGLRYLDAVMPREEEKLSQYLIPEVLGLYGRLKGRTKHAFSETMAESPEGSVISRAVLQEGQVGFPPDLLLNQLKIAPSFANFNGVHAVLDTDAFLAERMPFNIADVKKRMDLLHDRVNEAFRALITGHALEAWK